MLNVRLAQAGGVVATVGSQHWLICSVQTASPVPVIWLKSKGIHPIINPPGSPWIPHATATVKGFVDADCVCKHSSVLIKLIVKRTLNHSAVPGAVLSWPLEAGRHAALGMDNPCRTLIGMTGIDMTSP